jgi:hypothetical protein
LLDWLAPLVEGFPNARLLAESWLRWRTDAGGDLPPLDAVDPLDMVRALPWVWMWAIAPEEDVPAGEAAGAAGEATRGAERAKRLRLRLVGEEAKRAIGNWARGGTLESVCPAQIRPRVVQRYGLILDGPGGPSVLAVRGEVVFASGVAVPAFRLVLPLGSPHGGDRAAGLIGVTSYARDLGTLDTGGGLQGDLDDDHLLPVRRIA